MIPPCRAVLKSGDMCVSVGYCTASYYSEKKENGQLSGSTVYNIVAITSTVNGVSRFIGIRYFGDELNHMSLLQ